MAEFELEPGRLAAWAEKINGCGRDLKRQRVRVEEMVSRLPAVQNYQGVERALSVIAQNMGARQLQLEQYGDTLGNIVKIYRDTESEIAASKQSRR